MRRFVVLAALVFLGVTSEEDFYLGLSDAFASSGLWPESGSGDGEEMMCKSSEEVRCSCGENLNQSTTRKRADLDSTCPFFNQLQVPSSKFSFCEDTLRRAGYEIQVTLTNASSTDTLKLLNDSSLNKTIQELESRLRIFKAVLDRTVTGVLVPSKGAKCFCFERYKRWLCASHLPFYSDSNNCTIFDPKLFSPNSSSSSPPFRLYPCIEVCHDVLQNCPYYLPSRYQPQRPRRNESDRPPEPFIEVIYGGYPAFDCPRSEPSMSIYNFNCTCGHAPSHYGSRITVTCSILLLLLTIRTIT